MDFLKLVRDVVKSTVSAGVSFHAFITRSLKKNFDLTRADASVDNVAMKYPRNEEVCNYS